MVGPRSNIRVTIITTHTDVFIKPRWVGIIALKRYFWVGMGRQSESDAFKILEYASEVSSTLGESLVGPSDPSTPLGALKNAQQFKCRLWARTPALDDEGRIMGWDTLCGPYLRDIGEYPVSGSISQEPPPFTGGQCEVNYTISGTVKNFGSPPSQVTSNPVPGPILGVRIQSAAQVFGQFVGPAQYLNSQGAWVSLSGGGFGNNFEVSFGFQNVTVARVDGLPDDCGSLPPGPETVVPPSPQPGLPSLPPLPVVPGPYGDRVWNIDILPDGRITFDAGDGVVVIDPAGSGGVGSPGPPREISPRTGPSLPGSGGGMPDDNPDGLGPPPLGTRWACVELRIVGFPAWASIIFESGGSFDQFGIIGSFGIYYPDADGERRMSGFFPVKGSHTVVCVPIQGVGATGWVVNVKDGFSYEITPVSEPLEKTSDVRG